MNFAKHWAATLDDYVIDLAWSSLPGDGQDKHRAGSSQQRRDGSLLAAASAAGGITLYDAASGAVRHILAGHEDGANALAWMPALQGTEDGGPKTDILATGGQDGFVRFWDVTSGKQVAETKLGNAWVEHLVWQVGQTVPGEPSSSARPEDSPYLIAAAGKKLVALRSDGSIAHTFPDAPKTISALARSPLLAPRSPLLASACFGHVVVWDAATFVADREFPYGNAILALTWSPDGRWLVAGCHDNAVHLWAPAEDLELHMSGYETRLKELSFSHDSKWLATGGGRDVCVWDCAGAGPEGREPLQLPQTARTTAVAFQNQHGLLATGDAGGTFTLWGPTRKNPMVAEVKMPSAATKFAWRADDSLLAVGTAKGAVYVFKTEA